MKLAKCKIEKDGVRPGEDNLKAINDFERPRNKKNARQPLGKIWNEDCEKPRRKRSTLNILLLKRRFSTGSIG